MLVKAGIFIDGAGNPPKRNIYFSIADGRIASIGQKEDYSVCDVENACNYSEFSVLPGLIDSHVHLFLEGIFDLKERGRRWKEDRDTTLIRAVKNLVLTLERGVTTVRDLGGPYGIGRIFKKAVNQKIINGPRILSANQAISITGGHFYYAGGREVDGELEVIKAVREQIKAGADCLKFMLTGSVNFVKGDAGSVEFSQTETQVLVREAKRLGQLVAVHANGRKGVRQALKFEVDTLEHGALLDEETVDLLTESQVYWVPTLLPFQRMLDYSQLYQTHSLPYNGINQVYLNHLGMVSRAIERKAKILAGTDAGALGVEHGDIRQELSLLVKCGMTPVAAINSATGLAAKALGIDKEIGVLEEGKQADFIVVKGDVTANIDCLKQVEKVFKNGVSYI